jgi:type VI protein secretion system component VasF
MSDHPADLIAAANGSMTDHPSESAAPEAEAKERAHVDLHLSADEAEALLLALDALQPLRERLRAEIAPEPEPESLALEPIVEVVEEDHLTRATRLARESLQEARFALGERGPSPEQRRAWQDAARRYVDVTKSSLRGSRR